MSVTRYWFRPPTLDPEPFRAWSALCQRIAALAGRGTGIREPIVVNGSDGAGVPVFSPEIVALNGDGARRADHEPFEVPRVFPAGERARCDEDGRIFAFCKTAGKPYDAVVSACLIALEKTFGAEVRVEADAAAAAGNVAGEELFLAAARHD